MITWEIINNCAYCSKLHAQLNLKIEKIKYNKQMQDVQNQIGEIWSFGWPETNIFPGLVLEHQNDLNLLISRLSIL